MSPNVTVLSGSSTTVSVTAIGSPPMSFQWMLNGTPIDGATSSSYTIYPVDSATAGSYTCKATNTAGSYTSDQCFVNALPLYAMPYTISTLAGSLGSTGSANGAGSLASFYNPSGIAVDSSGNIYVADFDNLEIRKVTPSGIVTTFAGQPGVLGGADGPGYAAQFAGPSGLAIDSFGNLYVTDIVYNTIREITPSGMVTTIAGKQGVLGSTDGPGTNAEFASPTGIAVDSGGNLYVADTVNDTVRKIAPSGQVTTLAGSPGVQGGSDGVGSAARFDLPSGIAVDGSENLFVSDYNTSTIRMISPSGSVRTVAGSAYSYGSADGVGSQAQLYGPTGVALDSKGDLFVADSFNQTVRMLQPTGNLATLAGNPLTKGSTDGSGVAANFNNPYAVAVGPKGSIYITDAGNETIRMGKPSTAPSFTLEPSSQTVAAGSTVVFVTQATSATTAYYTWTLNGSPLADGTTGTTKVSGSTSPTLVITGATAANTGTYSCNLVSTSGAAESQAASLSVVGASSQSGRLINLSCRALSGTGGNQLIAGYVIGGASVSGTQPVLIRASGPALAPFGVTGTLADPKLTLNGASGVVASNTGWQGSTSVSATANQVGAFPWANSTSADSALVESLPVGAYTAQVSGASGDTGVTLAEIYDATPASGYTLSKPRLINISARVQVGTGGNVLIAGFVIGGATAKTVLIRASGPALKPFGVTGVLPDPSLSLFASTAGGSNTLVQSNTGWGGNAQIFGVAASVGAFSWGSAATPDSAILATLAPGAYTAEVSGASGDTGVALVEVYEVP
jgi:sugar lactone lactonase YvrE